MSRTKKELPLNNSFNTNHHSAFILDIFSTDIVYFLLLFVTKFHNIGAASESHLDSTESDLQCQNYASNSIFGFHLQAYIL